MHKRGTAIDPTIKSTSTTWASEVPKAFLSSPYLGDHSPVDTIRPEVRILYMSDLNSAPEYKGKKGHSEC